MYIPDKWVIIKINGDDPHYRVFGSWYGDYLNGDYWRMNSGIVKVEFKDENYLFHGSSGSIYSCHEKCNGIHAYGKSILDNYIKNNPEIEILPYDLNWIDMDWIIGK